MRLEDLKGRLHETVYTALAAEIDTLRPAQEKAIRAGLLEGKSLLVSSPTASGKTLIAELAMLGSLLAGRGRAVYIVPLKSLAKEKHEHFRKRWPAARVALTIGDMDKAVPDLSGFDIIITTSEKLDSMIRHKSSWLGSVATVVVDEIHLLNDPSRGPTLEILLTMLRKMLPRMQLIGLSATIGNPEELAAWLSAELVEDSYRPVRLKKGVLLGDELEFYS